MVESCAIESRGYVFNARRRPANAKKIHSEGDLLDDITPGAVHHEKLVTVAGELRTCRKIRLERILQVFQQLIVPNREVGDGGLEYFDVVRAVRVRNRF
jgi:hypothetical protein